MSVFDVSLNVIGFSEDDSLRFSRMLSVWSEKRTKNLLLTAYYEAHRPFKDLGISVPEQLQKSDAALGWPSKAIHARTRKHAFEGFSLNGEVDPFGVNETLARNQFDMELLQGISAAYKHSFSLLSSVAGVASDGDPDVIIRSHDAEWSAGIWDQRRRELECAVVFTDADESGAPVAGTVFFRHGTFSVVREYGAWRSEQVSGNHGRVMVELLPNDPQIGRPFGRSMITREVRYLTDAAVRTLVRGEVSAEFFASPQRWVLGADEAAFKDMGKWDAVTGRVLGLSNNEEGEKPTVGQFPQMTMSPHWEMYRQLAQNFCAATNLPQSAVGIYADNPASAEAMQAAEAQLAEDAEYQWRVFRPALLRLHQNVMILRGEFGTVSDLPSEAWRVNVNWTPARYVSPQAASDFAVKAVGADPALAGTTVLRRRMGLTQGEIEELQAETRRSGVSRLVDQLRGGVNVGQGIGAGTPPAVDAVEVAG